MKSYCQKFVSSIKRKMVKEEIGVNENKYHILSSNESGYFIHQTLAEGLELLKLNMKASNMEINMNERFEECFLFRFLIEGTFKIKYSKDEEYILEKDQLFLSYGKRTSTEKLLVDEDEKIKELIVVVSDEYLANFADNKNIKKCITFLKENLISNDKRIIKNLPHRLYEINNIILNYTVNKGNKLLVFAKTNEAMYMLLEVFLRNVLGSESSFETLDDEIESVKGFIDLNYNTPNLLEQLHKNFYTNRGELSKRFKKNTGIGMYEYLKKIKLEKAYEMLKSEDKKISEIANELGYDSYGYFSKIFNEYFGLNPKDIKKRK